MLELFWLFFVVLLSRTGEPAPGGGMDSIREGEEDCHRGGIVPC